METKVDDEIQSLAQQTAAIKNKIQKSRSNVEDPKLLAMMQQQLSQNQDQNKHLLQSLSKYSARDDFDNLCTAASRSQDAANRWTDNLYELDSYFKTKFEQSRDTWNSYLKELSGGSLDAEFDYVQ